MPLLACVSLPELPLQLFIRSHPDWRDLPVAVLTENRPTGLVLHRNRAAARAGVRRLMRYTSALALCGKLRAGVVREDEVRAGRDAIARRLLGFSPRVEPCAIPGIQTEQGIYWLDAGGLGYLFPTVAEWLDRIAADLETQGFRARLAAGYTRGGTLVAARTSAVASRSPPDVPGRPTGSGPVVFASREEELDACQAAPLRVLPLGPSARARLADLGIRSVKDFLQLPGGGVRLRLGPEATRLHDLLGGGATMPLQPLEDREELVIRRRFDREITDTPTLLGHLEEGLEAILRDVARVGARIQEIQVCLMREGAEARVERIQPSEPTAALDLVRGLVRLRIESVFEQDKRHAGITGFTLSVDRARAADAQTALAGLQPEMRRDRDAGERALALIRAEMGNDAVRRIRLQPEHPPEMQYLWERRERSGPRPAPGPPPHPPAVARPPALVRRIYEQPRPVPGGGVRDGRGGRRGCGGPYVVSGGWWSRPFNREYRFIETQDGAVLWIYRDRPDGAADETRGGPRTWMLQGLVR